jgi:hypothetical protein
MGIMNNCRSRSYPDRSRMESMVENTSRTRTTLLDGLHEFVRCYHSCAEDRPLFEPEVLVYKRILTIVGGEEDFETALRKAIVEINSLAGVKHYCGSGWFDFCLRVAWACRQIGLVVHHQPRADGGKYLVVQGEDEVGGDGR